MPPGKEHQSFRTAEEIIQEYPKLTDEEKAEILKEFEQTP